MGRSGSRCSAGPSRAVAAALAFAALRSACVGERPARGAALGDSAGVEVLRNARAADSSCVSLGLDRAVRIGGVGAEGPYDLLRVAGSTRLPDGRIAVVVGGTQELRFFDAAGNHLETVGRRGSGPGEFRQAGRPIQLGVDTLAVYDGGNLRLSLFSATGSLLATSDIRVGSGAVLVGRLEGGPLVFAKTSGLTPESPRGVVRDSMSVVTVAVNPWRLETLGRFPNTEFLVVGRGQSLSAMSLPFGRRTIASAAGSRVFVGDNAEYRIRLFDASGRLKRVVERATVPVAVTAEEIERARPRAERSSYERELAPFYDRAPLPRVRPAFAALAVDAERWLWVGSYVPDPDSVQRWDLFDRAGLWRCSVDFPRRFSVHEIGSDYVLGLARDEDGIEQVTLYQLQRSR